MATRKPNMKMTKGNAHKTFKKKKWVANRRNDEAKTINGENEWKKSCEKNNVKRKSEIRIIIEKKRQQNEVVGKVII